MDSGVARVALLEYVSDYRARWGEDAYGERLGPTEIAEIERRSGPTIETKQDGTMICGRIEASRDLQSGELVVAFNDDGHKPHLFLRPEDARALRRLLVTLHSYGVYQDPKPDVSINAAHEKATRPTLPELMGGIDR